jgi:hypothetical protein
MTIFRIIKFCQPILANNYFLQKYVLLNLGTASYVL